MRVLRLVRAIAVVIVPSLVLELLAVVSTVSTVRALLSRVRGDHDPRPLRPLALAGTIAPWLYLTLVRPWHVRWGATDEEVRKPLPGDEMSPEPSAQSTHAMTIEAPPEEVWPWLMQLGQGRGGWYSFDWLENLAGLEIHSRDRVVPGLQLEVGDPVRWGPEEFAPVAWRVRAIEDGRALILDGWAFVVEPLDGNSRSRLIARTRISGKEAAVGWGLLIELPHFLMERKMLKGIKQRAERNMNARNGTMNGKVVLVTGGTGGIGKDIAEGLASMGASVVVVGHDRSKGEAAVAEIKAKSGNEAVELMVADLSSQAEIHRLAQGFEANHDRLDVLINNAGAMYASRWETAEGIEGTLAVIHLAPVLLTNLLLPILQRSATSRIVNVSSWSHRRVRLNLDDIQMTEHFSPSAAYSRAKQTDLPALCREGDCESDNPVRTFTGATPATNPDRYRLVSPISHVDSSDPPTFLVQGGRDSFTPPEQSPLLARRLEEAGVEHRLLELPYAQHGFDLSWGGWGSQITRPELERFLEQHLGRQSPKTQ